MSMSGVVECTSCFEVKPSQDFPRTTLTPRCQHTATSCLACVALFLESQSRDGLVDRLKCPECPELLAYDAIEDYATVEVFERYKTYSIDRLVSGVSGYAWCPLGCGKGQVIGGHRGITLCLTCNRQFCPRHRMAWHVDYTCDEYDMHLADSTFRSKAQLNRENDDARASQDEQLTQRIQEADDLFAQSLMNEEQASQARLAAEIERRRLAEEKAAREAQRRREEEEARKLVERKKLEEDLTSKNFRSLTKPCPGCRVPIEKNYGCDHMHCIHCHLHFYWSQTSW